MSGDKLRRENSVQFNPHDADETQRRVLVADDDDDVRRLLVAILQRGGFEVTEARDGVDVLDQMDSDIQVAILDNEMPRLKGIELIEQLKSDFPACEVIMLSIGGVTEAVTAMRRGAFWYLQKPCVPDELLTLTERARSLSILRQQQDQLLNAISEPSFPEHGERSLVIPADIEPKIAQISALNNSVLITGEPGTGKSSLARAIHRMSRRRRGSFAAISCTAVPRELLEAELFGYERGAFAGDNYARPGRFEIAHGGTFFLDEIGELPMNLQPKVLRFLQSSSVERIGSRASKTVDIRMVASTIHDLEGLCNAHKFDEELYSQIKVHRLHLRPVRERIDEFPQLVSALVKKITARHNSEPVNVEKDAFDYLRSYHWPGNIRELENCLERAMLRAEMKTVNKDAVDFGRSTKITEFSDGFPYVGRTLREIELDVINQTVTLCKGNKRAAAQRLGISEKTIYNKLNRDPEKEALMA